MSNISKFSFYDKIIFVYILTISAKHLNKNPNKHVRNVGSFITIAPVSYIKLFHTIEIS